MDRLYKIKYMEYKVLLGRELSEIEKMIVQMFGDNPKYNIEVDKNGNLIAILK